MAKEYHDIDATSFAVGYWKTAAGGAGSGFADNADLTVQGGSKPIVTAVDWSSLTAGPNKFTVRPDRTGDLGTASVPVLFDCDTGTDPQTIDHGEAGTFFQSGNHTKWSIDKGPGGAVQLLGGTSDEVELINGYFEAAAAAVVTAMIAMGGRSLLKYNSTGVALDIIGGHHETNREGIFNLHEPCHLIIDVDPVADASPDIELNVYHPRASFEVRNGNVDVVRRYKSTGRITSRKALSFGGTTHISGPDSMNALAYNAALHTVAAYTPIGGGKRRIGPTPL